MGEQFNTQASSATVKSYILANKSSEDSPCNLFIILEYSSPSIN